MAGILDFLGVNDVPQGGILSAAPLSAPPTWQTKLGLIGAGLADAGAALNGRDSYNALAFRKMQAQDDLRRAYAAANSDDPAARERAYAAIVANGGDPSAIQKVRAQAALPQLLQNLQPSMGFNDNPVGVTPAVNATGPDADAARAAALQTNAGPAMSMQPSTLSGALQRTGVPELTAELAPQLIQNQIQQQRKQVRPVTDQERAVYGLSAKTPAVIDADGRVQVLSDPNAITPFQEENLRRLQTDAEEQRRHDLAMEANAAKASGKQSVPAGYRIAANGVDLEYIPGGPADPTKGAGKKAPTEDQAKNNQLYTRAAQQLPIVLDNFDALAGLGNQIGSMIPGTTALTSTAYQRADGGLRDIAASYLYSVSGATANPGEVENLVTTIRPKIGDSAQTITDKKQRLTQMVGSIKLRAQPGVGGGPQAPIASPNPQDLPRKNAPKTIRFEDLP